jgi:hypothetical protein
LPTAIGTGAWIGGAGEGGCPGGDECGRVCVQAESSRHNAHPDSRLPRKLRMWVVYLNVAIAVAIVAIFVVWTMRGRK